MSANTMDATKTQAKEMFDRLDKSPLSETVSAMNRIPEPIRALIERNVNDMLEVDFVDAMAAHLNSGNPLGRFDEGRMLNSAKLKGLSYAGYLSYMPWHLLERLPKAKAEIAAAIDARESPVQIHEILRNAGAVSLFIAAREVDDRTSYLRAAKALITRIPAAHVVLDAELITQSSGDLMLASKELGISLSNIETSARADSPSHSLMNSHVFKPLFIDTNGKEIVARAIQASANDPGADAPVVTTGPGEKARSRIEEVRARQMRAARRAA